MSYTVGSGGSVLPYRGIQSRLSASARTAVPIAGKYSGTADVGIGRRESGIRGAGTRGTVGSIPRGVPDELGGAYRAPSLPIPPRPMTPAGDPSSGSRRERKG